MGWIEKIQKKSQAEKFKIIIFVLILITILMFMLWILTSKIGKTGPKETTLFQTLGRGFKDIKEKWGK